MRIIHRPRRKVNYYFRLQWSKVLVIRKKYFFVILFNYSSYLYMPIVERMTTKPESFQLLTLHFKVHNPEGGGLPYETDGDARRLA